MRARGARSASGALAAVVALLVVTGAQADDPSSLRSQADRLQSRNAYIAGRERSAALELYALQSKLTRTENRVGELERRTAELERRRAEAERHLALVKATLSEAERQLDSRLRTLYVEGDPDPLAVLLGATSLDEALAGLDSLDRFARNDRRIVAQVKETRAGVKQAIGSLAAQQSRLAAVTADARSAHDALAAAAGQRASYLADLRREQELNRAEVARLSTAAEAAEQIAEELAAAQPALVEPTSSAAPGTASAPVSTPASPTASSGRTLTVQATGYSLRGTTATGVPTGWGVVAVDPSFIPLGTRMTVPGYGEGVAADTGSAVQGAIIDLWFPTREQAAAWGLRTVTITLH